MASGTSDMSAPWATPTQELGGLYGGFNCSSLLAGTNVLELAAHDMQVLGAPPPVSEAAGGLADAFVSAKSATSNGEVHKPVALAVSSMGETPACTDETPPATPRRKSQAARSQSPPGAPRQKPLPPLLGALCMDSLERVSEILQADPEAAAMPFWEHDVSPPLCSAVHHGCNASIVRLLMEKRADPDMPNIRGQTPLSILASTPSNGTGHNRELWVQGPPQRLGNRLLPQLHDGLGAALTFEEQAEKLLGWSLRDRGWVHRKSLAVAEVLAAAGADPTQPDPAGNIPLDLAVAAENDHLVRFWCRRPPELATVTEDASAEEGQNTSRAQTEAN